MLAAGGRQGRRRPECSKGTSKSSNSSVRCSVDDVNNGVGVGANWRTSVHAQQQLLYPFHGDRAPWCVLLPPFKSGCA